MMAPAMTTPSDERLAYASLARQSVRVERQLPVVALPRLAEVAPGRGPVTVVLAFRVDGAGRPRVSGRAEQLVETVCQRCLGEFEWRLAVEFDLCIVREGADVGEIAEGVDVLVVEGETVSVADVVEDELLLGLPERLCAEEPCPYAPALSYPAAVVERIEAADSPFSVLSKLKRPDS
jgi:uncharacterized protein